MASISVILCGGAVPAHGAKPLLMPRICGAAHSFLHMRPRLRILLVARSRDVSLTSMGLMGRAWNASSSDAAPIAAGSVVVMKLPA